MAIVYLGLGSNINPVGNLQLAVTELRRCFGDVRTSAVYRNAPVGFNGEDFLNLVARAQTELTPGDVIGELDTIHDLAGRRRSDGGPASRELDIDLLLYNRLVVDGDRLQLPRSDVLEYDFVLRPLAEIAPEYVHPVTGKRLADHWREFARPRRPLVHERIAFNS
jgi:2-amino-4-hydroxy-6-hydroxymethyldihydropteridine diphosphokinase